MSREGLAATIPLMPSADPLTQRLRPFTQALLAFAALACGATAQEEPAPGAEPSSEATNGEGAEAPAKGTTGPLDDLLEKTRTAQDQTTESPLAGFLKDLRLDYNGSADYLEEKFDAIAGLGDEVTPGLLELLAPEAPVDTAERNLARNARRVLQRMDLESQSDVLIDLFESGNRETRIQVLPLLGRAGGPRVEALLVRSFPLFANSGLVASAFDTDRRLGCAALSAQARAHVQHPDQQVRAAAVRHVYSSGKQIALPALREALRAERQTNILGQHIRGLPGLTSRDAETAAILLGILQNSATSLRTEDRRRLLRGLGTIAPLEHVPTAEFLETQVEEAPQFEDALQAGLGLRDLGEKRPERKVYDRAETEFREDPSGSTLEQFGDAYRAFDDFRKAEQAYKRAIDRDGRNPLFRRRLQRKLAAVYAASENNSKFAKAVEAAQMSRADLEEMAEDDPAVAAMLQNERVQKLLADIFKDD